jgi:peptide/nickel transport system substrate-binding protein
VEANPRSQSSLAKLLAALLTLAMIAAACGGDSDDAGGDEEAQPTEGDGGTAEPELPEEDDGEPVKGGRLVYGIEADTANPWAHYRSSCPTSCLMVFSAITDPLMFASADGEMLPHVLESMEPNADYTVWTMTVRDGIRFHDGSAVDGEAVKFNIETCLGSPLTSLAYANIGSVEAQGQTVTLTTAQTPWVALPAYFGGGQCSYMFSADWLRSLPDIPHRTAGNRFYDPELAATPADGDPARPVGLGAFVFDSYTPGNGNSFVAVRNEDYWRGPNGITDEDQPHLDAVEFVVAVDIESRSNGLRSGQFDIIHTANSDEISQYQDDDDFEVLETKEFGETSYILLNTAQGPTPWTSSASSTSARPDSRTRRTARSRRALSATWTTPGTPPSTSTPPRPRCRSAWRSGAPSRSSSRSTRRTTRSTSRATSWPSRCGARPSVTGSAPRSPRPSRASTSASV